MAIAGVGHSREVESFVAGQQAAREAVRSAGGPARIAILYATVLYDPGEILRGVRSVIGPEALLVGCSVGGISRLGGVDEVDRVVAVAVVGGAVRARIARSRKFREDPAAAGRELIEQLGPASEGSSPLLLWYDPLNGANVQPMLDALEAGGRRISIGAGAGQPWGPLVQTLQFHGDEILVGSVVALAFEGGVEMVFDVTTGTEPLGVELTVTAAEANVVQQIDGQSATEVWVEQLAGGRSLDSIDQRAVWALGVQLPGEISGTWEGMVTRAVFEIRSDTGELVLAAPIPTGTTFQLVHRTPEAVRGRALEMAHRLRERLAPERPILALSFECAARPRPFLGDEGALEEVCAMQRVLGDRIPWLGCYAWGEIAPIGSRTHFHNYTFPLAVLISRPEG